MRKPRVTLLIVGGIVAFYAVELGLRGTLSPTARAATLLTLVGAGLLAGALVVARQQRRFARTAWRATGTVTAIVTRRGPRGMGRASLLRFTTPTGEDFEFIPGYISPAMLEVGKQLPVLFDPHDPSRAEVESFGAQWLVPLILGGVGAAFAVAGLVLLGAALL
jgi:hypothetical protein